MNLINRKPKLLTLAANVASPCETDRERLRFLAACADLRMQIVLASDPAAKSRLDAVCSLCPVTTPGGEGVGAGELAAAARIHPLLERAAAAIMDAGAVAGTAGGFAEAAARAGAVTGTAADSASLLAKEGCNAFGVMAATADSGERQVRGGAVYHLASRVNHGCFPNVARFDNFDGAFDGGAFSPATPDASALAGAAPAAVPPSQLRLVALDRIPAGEEVLMSYLPVNEPVARRRRRIRHTFGFACQCQRCALEVAWAIEDGALTGGGSGAKQLTPEL